jgi:diguanylate cyclase (GGDEF)-like protein
MLSPQRRLALILAPLGDDVLAVLRDSPFGPFEPRVVGDLSDAPSDVAAIVVDADRAAEVLAHGPAAAVVVIADDPEPADLVDWLQRGAQDVVSPSRMAATDWPQRLRAAVERRRIADEVRRAVGIDLGTGLPDQQQLVEHMSHLMALRTREPAPMALLVLRVEGLATAQARLGREAANVLRRKLAVRLRSGVRASDVVASLGEDRFAVLLASMLAAADAQRVVDKLLAALAKPFHVAGQSVAVALAPGVGQFPADGDQPDRLLARAAGLAAAAPAQGRSGFANFAESGPPQAAND